MFVLVLGMDAGCYPSDAITGFTGRVHTTALRLTVPLVDDADKIHLRLQLHNDLLTITL